MEHEGGIGEKAILLCVDRVAKNGAADVGAVDPELVGPAGFWIEGEE